MSSLPTKTKVHLIPSLFSIQRLDVLPAVYKASPSAYIMITSVHHYEMNLFKIDPAEKIVQTQFCTQEVNVIVVSKHLLCDLCVCVCVPACAQCPAGTEPVLGYEYKWWNVLPSNMKTSCFNVGNSKCDDKNGEHTDA